ncbi:hypothetical protein ACKKBG_A28935 [Auxenochlorella protothecoides x Auxenochlorella symbiontica]
MADLWDCFGSLSDASPETSRLGTGKEPTGQQTVDVLSSGSDDEKLAQSTAYIASCVRTRRLPLPTSIEPKKRKKESPEDHEEPVNAKSLRRPMTKAISRSLSAPMRREPTKIRERRRPEPTLDPRSSNLLHRINALKGDLIRQFDEDVPAQCDAPAPEAVKPVCSPPRTNAHSPPRDAGEEDRLMLTVECQQGRKRMRMKRLDPFSKLFESFERVAREEGWLDSGALRFVFDGETVAGTLSPRDLDLEGDEVIEAYPL